MISALHTNPEVTLAEEHIIIIIIHNDNNDNNKIIIISIIIIIIIIIIINPLLESQLYVLQMTFANVSARTEELVLSFRLPSQHLQFLKKASVRIPVYIVLPNPFPEGVTKLTLISSFV